MSTTAAVYCRISRDREGREVGVKRQEEDCRALAERRGWEVAEVIVDNDLSASSGKRRPGWERLLKALEAGEYGALVAYSSSRMYRRIADLGRLIDLANDHVQIATVVSGEVNLTTADGRMMARVLASIDQGEAERNSERVKRALAGVRAQGRWTGGRRPFGYMPGPDGVLIPHEPEALLIREATEHPLNGGSLGSLVRDWSARSVTTTTGKPWSRTNLRDMLLRPKPGVVADRDTRKLRELFDGLSTGKGREKRARRLLTGLLVCGICGQTMKSRAPSYVCEANGTVHLRVTARALDVHVLREAALRSVPEPERLSDPKDPLIARLGEIEVRLEELAVEFATGSTFAAAAAKNLEAEKASLEAQLFQLAVAEPGVEEFEVAQRRAMLSPIWGARSDQFATDIIADPAARSWLERLVESVKVQPVGRAAAQHFRGGERIGERVKITWRDGVVIQ